MEVILDSSFIISCIKKKIDFLSQLEEKGFRVLLPKEVFEELKDLRLGVKREERTAIETALGMFSSKSIKSISLGNNKVDVGLIEKGRLGYYIASLDSHIKNSVSNRVIISDSKKSILIQRD